MMSDELSELTLGRAVSAVLQEYMEPLLSEWWHAGGRDRSMAELHQLLQTPWTIWNAVVYHDCCPEADRHSLLANMRERIPVDAHELQAILEFFIRRKREQFGEYRYLFREFEFRTAKDGDITCRAETCLPGTWTTMD